MILEVAFVLVAVAMGFLEEWQPAIFYLLMAMYINHVNRED
jgi:hypothetical protein